MTNRYFGILYNIVEAAENSVTPYLLQHRKTADQYQSNVVNHSMRGRSGFYVFK